MPVLSPILRMFFFIFSCSFFTLIYMLKFLTPIVTRARLKFGSCIASSSSSLVMIWFDCSRILTSMPALWDSFLVMRVYATPSLSPALPVRPIRWMWSSLSLEQSKLITVLIEGISRPLLATLVAIRILSSPLLNFVRICVLSNCDLSPCIEAMPFTRYTIARSWCSCSTVVI